MITFKQMDALYWIVTSGSFESAASKLNMSQSAISKRIHELEESFNIEIFDRSSRSAQLTEKGRELLDYCTDIIHRRDQLLERISDKKVLISRLRLGVTELTAMTWLPSLIESIRTLYPKVRIEPSIELSSVLYENINNDLLDLIIVPDIFNDVRLISVPLKNVENAWMCSPKLIPPGTELDLLDIPEYSFLLQGSHSGTGLIYERYFSSRGVTFNKHIISNNLLAQIGLAISGIGITYLPVKCLNFLVEQKKLGIIRLKPAPPLVRYSVMYRTDRTFGIVPAIAEKAVELCDFSNLQIAVMAQGY
ncbi:LysR family transcriptional regulator [Brenneria rubrifaciens]|uniref:LysR family transcriptional regulator n=1 Tax=Brenneria rubrifaciens TaxID=55213 RepID=A0A4P8QRD0_9GAMM|nr:LysR family transcriptional regulator [Brenneria rubrifaciens]QCR09687.1 LysR family transcriptional regulator [Brenneria rubrifaciens]